MTIDDLGWTGDERSETDPFDLLKQHGYEPDTPLEMLLRAIIEENPDEGGRPHDARLEIALGTLLGSKRQVGRKHHDDQRLLHEIAKAYFSEYVENKEYEPDLAPIIRRVLSKHPEALSDGGTPDSIARRLRLKFSADRDLLLTRATYEDAWDSRDTLRALGEIADRMRRLGIRIGDPRRRAEAKGP